MSGMCARSLKNVTDKQTDKYKELTTQVDFSSWDAGDSAFGMTNLRAIPLEIKSVRARRRITEQNVEKGTKNKNKENKTQKKGRRTHTTQRNWLLNEKPANRNGKNNHTKHTKNLKQS